MSTEKPSPLEEEAVKKAKKRADEIDASHKKAGEKGGFEKKAEPTRHGDWETDGRCSDF